MRPTASQVHHDGILQNITIMYRNKKYINEEIAPVIPVEFASDYYYEFTKADFYRDTADYRAPGTSSNRNGFGTSKTKYNCKEISQSTDLPDEIYANADSVLQIDKSKTDFCTEKIMLKKERMAESLFMTTSNWDNSATPTNTWDDYVNSDPVTDIETAIDALEYCNTAIMAKDVWKKLKHHPALLAKLSNNTKRILTPSDFQELFEIEKLFIGIARYNTELQGQTASYSDIWTKDMWLGYITNTPGLMEPTATYTFSWDYTGSSGNELKGTRGVRRWRDENVHSDIIEAYESFDMKSVGSDLGYVLEDAIN
jgi:hypothetical protein